MMRIFIIQVHDPVIHLEVDEDYCLNIMFCIMAFLLEGMIVDSNPHSNYIIMLSVQVVRRFFQNRSR